MESLDNLKRQGQQYISKSDEGVCMGMYMGLCDYDIWWHLIIFQDR